MSSLVVVNHIEDLQVLCFAIIFAVMCLQEHREKILRYLLLSYSIGSVVSLTDVWLNPTPQLAALNLFLISTRYAAMAYALAAFVKAKAWFSRSILAACLASASGLVWAFYHAPQSSIFVLDYGTLTLQFVLLSSLLAICKEASTRAPRLLLALLFFASMLIRCGQIVLVLHPAPKTIWLRDQMAFVNCTLVGCMVPFTIIWLMNARVHSELRKQSAIDPLTGLLNRRGLEQAVTREMARYARDKQNFAVAVADLDHFKVFNDTHGHGCGDLVLQTFAEIARSTLRQTDIIARTGGEEFTVLLALTSAEEMESVMDRVRLRLEGEVIETVAASSVVCTVSVGLTNTFSRSEVTWQALLKEADTALYKAKHSGRNRIVRSL